MAVVGEVDEGAERHAVALLGFGQHSYDDRIEIAMGFEEKATVKGAAGDFDEGVGWNEAKISAHGELDVSKD